MLTNKKDFELTEKLRIETGMGMMLCKQALTNTNHDFNKAIQYIEQYKKSGKIF